VFCPGKADSTPGRNLVLLGTDPIVLAHELGHTLGLTHATGRNPRIVPGGAIPLPYAGIGGVGTLNGVAGVTEVFPSATRGDLMSYDTNRWTSPKTWAVMHRRILDEGGTIKTQAASSARARAAVRTPGTPAVRRVVSGILRGTDTTLDSLVTEASAPKGTGPVAARVIARNARGKKLASADIRGVPEQEEGETSAALPFVIDLPNKKRIASLQVLPSRGGKPLVRLRASRHAPTGRFVKLPRRARAKRPLNLRWTASDRDPRDELSTLLLARRGKSTWRTIVLGPGVGRLAVNPSTLGNGKALRLRLRISDGFRTSVVNARKITLR
jgi:hypothetical protein